MSDRALVQKWLIFRPNSQFYTIQGKSLLGNGSWEKQEAETFLLKLESFSAVGQFPTSARSFQLDSFRFHVELSNFSFFPTIHIPNSSFNVHLSLRFWQFCLKGASFARTNLKMKFFGINEVNSRKANGVSNAISFWVVQNS